MVSKRFHLTMYRVLHEESESELKNDQILQPYAVLKEKKKTVQKIYMDFIRFLYKLLWGILQLKTF